MEKGGTKPPGASEVSSEKTLSPSAMFSLVSQSGEKLRNGSVYPIQSHSTAPRLETSASGPRRFLSTHSNIYPGSATLNRSRGYAEHTPSNAPANRLTAPISSLRGINRFL
ncbi:hypothetical protein R80B4_02600 [Fibrobacteres bacterium R8-0-B4]